MGRVMLSHEQLIKEISNGIGKEKVIKLSAILKKEQFAIRDLIDITFHHDHGVSFRAAWLLENLFLQKPELYVEHIEYLVSRVRDVVNPSCKRHYAKIIMHITSLKAALAVQ